MTSAHFTLLKLRTKFQLLNRAGFVRSVVVLVGGTAFAQALTVLVLPLITRLYTPGDFNVLAVYSSILAIASAVACLRLEIAIPMPELDEDAANLLAIALCSCTMIAVLIGFGILLFPSEIVRLVDQKALRQYLWLLPLGIWFTSAYAALQFWAMRKKRFGTIAKTRMSQAIGGAGTQLGMGLMGASSFGLLLGQAISSGAGLIGLATKAVREDHTLLQRISWLGMRQMLQQYQRFPKHSTAEAFANSAGIQLPVIIIAALAVGPEAGYLMLATRVMAVPMALIGGAIAQVYLSRAPTELRAGTLGSFSAEILGGLYKTGIGPLLCVGIVSPTLFAIVFGSEWVRAGELVAWMIPWFIFQFMSSPISMVMHVKNRQKAMLALTVFGLFFRLGLVVLAVNYAQVYLSEIYAISGGIFYFCCYWVFSSTAEIDVKKIVKIYIKSFPILAIWILIGIILKIIFRLF